MFSKDRTAEKWVVGDANRKGGYVSSPARTFTLSDGNLLFGFLLGLFLFRQAQSEDAFLVLGINGVGIDTGRQFESPDEGVVTELPAGEFFVFLLLLIALFGRNAQNVVVQLNLKIFLVHAGYGQLHFKCFVFLLDVNRRGFVGHFEERIILEKTINIQDIGEQRAYRREVSVGFFISDIVVIDLVKQNRRMI